MGSLGWGFKVGHFTDEAAGTGCTVIIPPPGNVSSCDIPGSSPGSREIESLHPDKRLTEIHALLLTGGSAFGLAAADGVMRWLAERDIGYRTPVATIPIVPAAVVFDLGAGRADVRPGPTEGYAACEDAREHDVDTGRVGAGTGCTVGKWAGREFLALGGLGIGAAEQDGERVTAIAVVNAVGDVLDGSGGVLAGTSNPTPSYRPFARDDSMTNTVLAGVFTEATLDKRDVRFLASRGSDGITQTIRPAHTRYDGDAVFAVAAPPPEPRVADLDVLGFLATEAIVAAIRQAVS